MGHSTQISSLAGVGGRYLKGAHPCSSHTFLFVCLILNVCLALSKKNNDYKSTLLPLKLSPCVFFILTFYVFVLTFFILKQRFKIFMNRIILLIFTGASFSFDYIFFSIMVVFTFNPVQIDFTNGIITFILT